ncbi:MAG: glycine cleavage system protein H [Rhodospirillaceae bacterium]|nr:glycine cleavage system protein H [Rhodospirillaceae bacterium]MCY4066253.1 glycine cleavage system protein H [Rhodospirillaceae bacterium]MXW93209.1 glycine cleavage system protein H [Rhodospirillaceae bacterium]MYB11672.1 glycine cleavage system protein H [Rhodospirillaceae bacterium]MYI49732.1 glycine cleavage system protein H [Rhodospirillaceae bacterium]
MPTVRGCHLPDDLLYDVPNHIWFTETGDGNLRLGMTSVATAMAGNLVAFTPKKVGRSVKAGRSCATVESGKWVGPAKSAAGGEVVEVNDALVEEPSLANQDPYSAWMVVLRPDDWDSVKPTLTPGTDVAAAYEAKMDEDGFAGCE